MTDPLSPSQESPGHVGVRGHGQVTLPRWLAYAIVALLVLAVWQQLEIHQLRQSIENGVIVSNNDSGELQQLGLHVQGLQDCVVALKTMSAAKAADVCPTTNG